MSKNLGMIAKIPWQQHLWAALPIALVVVGGALGGACGGAAYAVNLAVMNSSLGAQKKYLLSGLISVLAWLIYENIFFLSILTVAIGIFTFVWRNYLRGIVLFTIIFYIVFVFTLSHMLLSGRFFQGNGEFSVKGGPFLYNYNLLLPEFPMSKEGTYTFTFRNYCSMNGGEWVTLIAKSNEKIAWWDLTTRVKVSIVNASQTKIFFKNSALNSHDHRNRGVFGNPKPYKNEWFTWYSVRSRSGRKAESMRVSGDGIKELNSYYSDRTFQPLKCIGKYLVRISVTKPATNFPEISGRITIGSSWK